MNNPRFNFIVFLIFILLCLRSLAQPSVQWQKVLGGSSWDWGYAIQQTADGGYVMAGGSGSTDGDATSNHGVTDFWIVKLDSDGNIQWQKSLGGSEGDICYSIQQTADHGYIMAGASKSNNGDVSGHQGTSSTQNFWVVKLDSTGSLEWQKSLGGTSGESANSIQQTTDGGYIIAGTSCSNDGDVTGHHGPTNYTDCWVVKLDSVGNKQWQKSLGGTATDVAQSIQQTLDGGYIVAGYSASTDGDVTGNHGNTDSWVVKLSGTGNLIWQKSFGGSQFDNAYSIQLTPDAGYIMVGSSSSTNGDVTGNHGNDDYWVVKLDSAGVLQWQKSFGGSQVDYGHSIRLTTDGGYVIAGMASSNDGDVTNKHGLLGDYWIIKIDSLGNIEWQKSFGASLNDFAYSIEQTSEGGYIMVGCVESIDGDLIGNHGYYDSYVVKLNAIDLGLATANNSICELYVYPNPAKHQINIIVQQEMIGSLYGIMNLWGQTLISGIVKDKKSIVDITLLPNGVYTLNMGNENIKLIKQ